MGPKAAPGLRLRLSAAAERAVRHGHPWVFAESVREQNRTGTAGELAAIYSTRSDRFLAIGLLDPDSPLRVRILHRGAPVRIDAEWWRMRLEQAIARREGLFGPETNGYRIINGESDGWPGLVLDRYAGTLVLKLYTSAWLPRLPEVERLIVQSLHPESLVLRLSRNLMAAAQRDYSLTEGERYGPPADGVPFLENGMRFMADVQRGQKTGFFLDQRDNRQRVRELAAGAGVLNAFSYSGAFSVAAAMGGARSAVDLDQSAHALAAGASHFALNPASCIREQVQADAFDWLAHGPPQRFDLIITDPPSLAKRENERAGALAAYAQLAVSAMQRLRRGGIFVASSCSAHVTAEEFFATVQRAAAGTELLWTSGHAADHPATFPEAHYLKCIALRTLRVSRNLNRGAVFP